MRSKARLLIYSILSFLLSAQIAFSKNTFYKSFVHDDIKREYILHIPDSYNPDQQNALVLCFHGYSGTAFSIMNSTDFRKVADSAGFIVAFPQGTKLNGVTHWNVGKFSESTVDDIGFTEALIDTISSNYNIDSLRVYSTGMSNGGFMSYLLACQLSNRIAAIASVTGSMTIPMYNECRPTHPTPVMQIHGTADSIVLYNGSTWSKSMDEVLEYWVDYNNCNDIPERSLIPDINKSDECSAEKFEYKDGDNEISVMHIKIYSGDHSWPEPFKNAKATNQDFSASQEIWNFFSKYNLNGLIKVNSIGESKEEYLSVYPNPADDFIELISNSHIDHEYQIYNLLGEIVRFGNINSNNSKIDVSSLPQGIYFIMIYNNGYLKSRQFAKVQ